MWVPPDGRECRKRSPGVPRSMGARRRIESFALGAHNIPDRLLIPEKLYGRVREIGTMLALFGKVRVSARTCLVSGTTRVGQKSEPILLACRQWSGLSLS